MKVLGIGNALVDIMVSLPDDSFLRDHKLPKGSMQLVDKETSDSILHASQKFETRITSGGSSANTINGLSKLGVESGFIGVLGEDDFGRHFINDFEKNQVKPHLIYSKNESGRAVALVSPDGERTFATYLGAAIELGAPHIDNNVFSNYNILHIEGYLLQNYELVERAIQAAKANGVHVSLDLASFNVVEDHLDFLKNFILQNVDILFANEEEAKALTQDQVVGALRKMSEMVPLSIVKTGASGSMICNRNEIVKVEAIPSICRDTTGAGDLYAAGFLYGLILGETIEECGRFGSVLAGHVIEVIGAKIQDNQWKQIYELLYLSDKS